MNQDQTGTGKSVSLFFRDSATLFWGTTVALGPAPVPRATFSALYHSPHYAFIRHGAALT